MKGGINTLLCILLLTIYSCTKATKEPKDETTHPIGQTDDDESIDGSTDTIVYRNNIPNASNVINLKNYLGNTENIHPKVLYFEKGWRGYKFWMAYTPYPRGQVKHENPCIAVSQDGINWTTPKGLKEIPLDPQYENGYNSDTHLVYRKDLDIIECWYRPYNTKIKKNSINRRVSHDGINWQSKEVLIGFDGVQMLSPAIEFDDNKYKIWYCYEGEIRYIESLDASAKNWPHKYERIKFDWTKYYPWHMDVIKTDKGFEMIVCAWERSLKGANNNTADLFYCSTDDQGLVTRDPFPIIKRNTNPNCFDTRSIYRSSFIKIKGKYYIFYSSISEDWTRSMALSVFITSMCHG